jgi:hypothetical protein
MPAGRLRPALVMIGFVKFENRGREDSHTGYRGIRG